MKLNWLGRLGVLAMAALLALGIGAAQAQKVVKIAYIDVLSGPMANVGDNNVKHFEYFVDRINAKGGAGGMKLELLKYDNELSADKSLILLKKAIDEGARIVVQGNSSSVAAALIDAIGKYNARNPDDPVMFLNHSATDPILTNERCSYWHVRYDFDVDMKINSLTDYMVKQPSVKKVYLFNQDYAFGQALERGAIKMLGQKSKTIQVVGHDLIPLGKVKDFAPYVAKIQASGADTVITGNWGPDLSLMLKAATDAGYKGKFYTFYVGGLGTPSTIGKAGKGTIQLSEWHNNIPSPEIDAIVKEFGDKYHQDFYYYRVKILMDMLEKAINQTKSGDPKKLMAAIHTMKLDTPLGQVWVRPENHQVIQPMYIAVYTDENIKHQVENSGMGLVTIAKIEAKDTVLPTTCKMEIPK